MTHITNIYNKEHNKTTDTTNKITTTKHKKTK